MDLALTCSALASGGYSGDCSRMRVTSGAVIFSLEVKCPVAGRMGRRCQVLQGVLEEPSGPFVAEGHSGR